MYISDRSEADLIARIQARLPPPPSWLVVGIGDDAAVAEPAPRRLEVLTVDALVEGVHFDRRFTPPDAIGHRALAVNLSDLAAMGAEPRLALLSLALPPDLPLADFDGLVDGLTRLAAAHRVHVVGGNLTRSPGPLMVDVTVTGTAKRRQILTRSGARAGDELWVTGTLGAAAAGLEMLQAGEAGAGACAERFLYPAPRVRAGVLLARNRAATACVDLSDGLAEAVHQMAGRSGVGAILDAGALPVESAAREWFAARGDDPVRAALTRSDDYELLFAVRPHQRGRLRALQGQGQVPLTRVGVCTEDPAVLLKPGPDGPSTPQPLPGGFTHFRAARS